jgi:hypothetical protein
MLDRRRICGTAVTAALGVVFSGRAFGADAGPISPKAERLARFYDGLDVEHLWPAGVHVNWETGVPDGIPERSDGKHTHCSAFVGSVAKQLGIYILRPPEHGQVLLANAQLEWLETVGGSQGWQSLPDAMAAQVAANRGLFVVASYHNHSSTRPGHIAIVRPSTKSADQIAYDGPDVIQAGGHNYTSTTLALGFAGHPSAWGPAKEVRFFAHEVP